MLKRSSEFSGLLDSATARVAQERRSARRPPYDSRGCDLRATAAGGMDGAAEREGASPRSDVRGDASRGATSDGVRRARLGERRADADTVRPLPRAANRVGTKRRRKSSQLYWSFGRCGASALERRAVSAPGTVSRQRRAPDLVGGEKAVVPSEGAVGVYARMECVGVFYSTTCGPNVLRKNDFTEAKHAHEPLRSTPPREASRATAARRPGASDSERALAAALTAHRVVRRVQ